GAGGVGLLHRLVAARRPDRGHAAVAHPRDRSRRRRADLAAGGAALAGGGRADAAADAGARAGPARHLVAAAGGLGRVVCGGLVRPAPPRAARYRRWHRVAANGLSFTYCTAPTRFNPPMPSPPAAEL